MRKLQRIEKFYFILVFLLIALSMLVIFILRFSFYSFTRSQDVDQQYLDSNTPKLDKQSLDDAYGIIYNKQIPDLDL
jgi:hypothetical protein